MASDTAGMTMSSSQFASSSGCRSGSFSGRRGGSFSRPFSFCRRGGLAFGGRTPRAKEVFLFSSTSITPKVGGEVNVQVIFSLAVCDQVLVDN
mmetsp:Transcript_29230/g.70472  ORF Transcript_29230/g.70472 Transcript_29230/m.70472 type:complete len:93 (-) Transcript_29230:1000-1278(-)